MVEYVERIVIGRNHPNWKACHRMCSHARKLGNCATYIMRHRIFDKKPYPTRKELDHAVKEMYPSDYRAMPSAASAQRIIQVIGKEFKSYMRAKHEFSVHPQKFLGQPRLPGYKNRYRTFVVGRNGFQISKNKLILTGGEEYGFVALTIRCCANQVFNAKATETRIGDVRIVAKGNSFIVELTYRVGDQEEEVKKKTLLDDSHACLIDVGIENLATIVSTRPGVKSALVKGGILKSINRKYNKDVAKLRSRGHREHIAIKGFKRERQISDCFHKVSRWIVNYCLINDLGKIVIGHNKGWKQEVNLGHKTNQRFVFIPYNRLIEMIRYKAQAYGIEVIVREESYTSKASAIDMDHIPTIGKEKAEKPMFSGKRIERGLYKTVQGKLLNADAQAAANLGRKELGDEWLEKRLGVDGGAFLEAPVVLRCIGHAKCGCNGHC